MDSINANPPGVPSPGAPSWLHTDQGPRRTTPLCIQGLVNLASVSAETTGGSPAARPPSPPGSGADAAARPAGTILLKDGSHLAHERFFDEACCRPREEQASIPDFYQFAEQERAFFEQFPTVLPACGAGSLVLWDSRTAHQARAHWPASLATLWPRLTPLALQNELPDLPTAFRQVCYCCYQPRAFATEADLAVKRQGWDAFRVSTHWPAYQVALFPEGGSGGTAARARGRPGYGSRALIVHAAEYYEAHDNGRQVPRHVTHKSRGDEEDALARQLAGVQPWPAGSVWRAKPLLECSLDELRQQGAQMA